MTDINELRDRAATFGSDYLTDEEWVAVIDRLEAAEKERDAAELMSLALRAKIEQMERQEPVAWYSKQYGFVYMSRQPSQFEHGSILYLRNGAPAWRIEGSSKVALLDIASLPHGTVFYALPGAQPAPSVPEFCPCCGNIMRACMICPNEDCNAVTVTAEQAKYNKQHAVARKASGAAAPEAKP